MHANKYSNSSARPKRTKTNTNKQAHNSANDSKHSKHSKHSHSVRLKLRQQLDLARDLGRVHEGALARRFAVLVDHVEADRQQGVAVLSERDEARRVARLVKGEHVSARGKAAGGTWVGATWAVGVCGLGASIKK